MPTKHPRLNVTFPDQAFYDRVYEEARMSRRSMSDQIIFVLDGHYANLRKELLNSTRLFEGETSGPVFDGPPPSPERVLEPRANQEKGKS